MPTHKPTDDILGSHEPSSSWEALGASLEEGGASPVAGGMYDGGQKPVQEVLAPSEGRLDGVSGWVDTVPRGPAGLFFVRRENMSRGSIVRILRKYGLEDVLEPRREKKPHYKVRRQARRAKYWRYQRPGKLRRDEREKTTPEGLYRIYRNDWRKKGRDWRITLEDWMEVQYRQVDGMYIYNYIYNIYRLDKNSNIVDINSIYIVDRYTNKILYKPKEL